MAKGLAVVIGMGKPKDKGEGIEPAPESEPGDEDEKKFAEVAYDAMRDGDKGAFTEAFLGAIRACTRKESEGEYGEGDEQG